MKRLTAIAAAAAISALAITGCEYTPPNFQPKAPGWPVGYGPTEMRPGVWAPTQPNTACSWQIYVPGNPIPVDRGTFGPVSQEAVVLVHGVKIAHDCAGFERLGDLPRYAAPTPGARG